MSTTKTESQYEKQARELLEKMGITYSVTFLGDDCPRFCEDHRNGKDMDKINTFPRSSHIHGKHYRCTLERKQNDRIRVLAFDFWNSYRDEEHNYYLKNRPAFDVAFKVEEKWREAKRQPWRFEPTAYDLLACLQKYHPGTFEDFCSEFGYDTDSRRAFDTYAAVLEEFGKVSSFFTAPELEQIAEVQ